METLAIVDGFDELADGGPGVGQVVIVAGGDFSCLSVFMTLSAMAFSYGQPARLMLGRMATASRRGM